MPFRLSGPESDGRSRYDVCPSDDKLSVGCLHVLLFHSPADLFVDLIASVDYPFRHGRDDSVLHVLLYPAGVAEILRFPCDCFLDSLMQAVVCLCA